MYSAVLVNDRDSFGTFDIDGDKFHFRAIDFGGRVIDEIYLDLSDPFRMDGALDAGVPLRADNGMRVYAAIKGHHLYVATQDAASGNDHFVYVSRNAGAARAANWGKSGEVAGWDAYIADESSNGYARWFDANGAEVADVMNYQVATPGLANNGDANNGVLEGMVDMRALWGGIPETIHVAAAAYETWDGGKLLARTPTGGAQAVLPVNARSIALDLPTAVVAAPASSHVESGKFVILDGSASQNPSGLPLTYTWKQVSGPPCLIADTASATTAVRSKIAVKETQAAEFELIVNDTRFDSDPVKVRVTIDPLPPGAPADSDGDGVSDEDEARAGTDAFDASDVLRIRQSGFEHPAAGGEGRGAFTLSWPSVPGKTYRVRYAEDIKGSDWKNLGGPVVATETVTTATDPDAAGRPRRFYQVIVE